MRRLTILRHAKSSWSNPGLDDHDRPLAKRGIRDAPRMGERLRARGADPQVIVSSSAKRALRTAEIVADALGGIGDRITIEPELYLASPGKLVEVVARQDPGVLALMIVGHNPGLTQLVNGLLPSLMLANLPTCGVVTVDLDLEGWNLLDCASIELAYYDYPKNAEAVVSRS